MITISDLKPINWYCLVHSFGITNWNTKRDRRPMIHALNIYRVGALIDHKVESRYFVGIADIPNNKEEIIAGFICEKLIFLNDVYSKENITTSIIIQILTTYVMILIFSNMNSQESINVKIGDRDKTGVIALVSLFFSASK